MQFDDIPKRERGKCLKRRIKRAPVVSGRKKSIQNGQQSSIPPTLPPKNIFYRKHHYLGKEFTEIKQVSQSIYNSSSTILTKSEIKFVMGSFNSIYKVGNAMVNVLDQTYSCGDWNILSDNRNNKRCNCTKSMCENAYCECVKMGKVCGQGCYCIGCNNKVRKNLTKYFESLNERYMEEKEMQEKMMDIELERQHEQRQSSEKQRTYKEDDIYFKDETINIIEDDTVNKKQSKWSPTTLSSSPRMLFDSVEHSPTTQCSSQQLSQLATCNCTQRQCLSNYCICHRKGINCSHRCGCRICRN